jgi:hypothetical protein
MWALHADGATLAERIAELVNAHILNYARRVAEATQEIQNPPQVYPRHVTRRCATCAGDGSGSVTIRLGTAVEVWPERLKASWRVERARSEDNPT